MKTLENLTINDVVYIVTADEIKIRPIVGVIGGAVVLKDCYNDKVYYYQDKNDSSRYVNSQNETIYIDLDAAYTTQLNIRRRVIQNAKKEMEDAIAKYCACVEKYKATCFSKVPKEANNEK